MSAPWAVLVAAGLALLLPGASVAQDTAPRGLADRGRAIAENGTEAHGDAAGAAPCASCHGMDGLANGTDQFPRLDGQSGIYLAKQLEDYAAGRRQNEIMTPIAQSLTQAQRQEAAAYYGSLPVGVPPQADPAAGPTPAPDPAQLQRGRGLVEQGSADLRVQACTSCHGPDGAGLPPALPRLAGQWAAYGTAQFQAFRDGTRSNDPSGVMREVAHRLGDADVAAVVAYLASLNPATRP